MSAIAISVWGQADSVIGQFTNSTAESVAGSITGDGRFVVFESRGNIATENPRNADNNREIFLWDFAQRRIFQITNTKSVLNDHFGTPSALNTRVDIINKRPVISSDGRWIAFASNAYPVGTCAAGPTTTNPGNFDGNACTSPTPTPTPTPTGTPTPTPSPTATPVPTPTPNNNPLITDANLEIFLYEVPATTPVDLTTGEELPLTDLSVGTFTRVTDTPASRPPLPATTLQLAFVAEDNRDISISDNGEVLSFTSTRDLIPGSNTFPGNDNDEIFVFTRSLGDLHAPEGVIGGTFSQITVTPRGSAGSPIYNKNSAISGDGSTVVFASTGDDPVPSVQPTPGPTGSPVPTPQPFDCIGGSNPSTSRNEEVFYVPLNASRVPTECRQITTTTPTNPGDPVNIFDLGKRISRDGRFVVFDSYADLAGEHSGANQAGFASFLFDSDVVAPANPYKRFLPRSDADSAAAGGDVPRFPSFTDYGEDGQPDTIVLETRLNIKPDGTFATTATDGLNQDAQRPTQIYKTSAPLATTTPTPAFVRLTKFPISTTVLAFTQPLPSNSSSRIAFDLPATELGTGNQDGQKEIYYLYLPEVINPAPSPSPSGSPSQVLTFWTGASRLAVNASPTPTPSPTATPTPTPTPSPSPSGSPVPTPTPVTPSAVLGLSPGMLAIMNYSPSTGQPTITRTAVGSLQRSFTLPITLSGVSLTINGVACGLKSVNQTEVVFVVPPFLSSAATGTSYPIVLNNNGTVYKSDITIVPTRPDIFTNLPSPGPLGRALAENVVNRVHTTEPFTVNTVQLRGGRVVPTLLRLRVTGIANTAAGTISIRIGSVTIQGTQVLTGGVLVEPGVYTVDFQLPGALRGAGDQPIIVMVNVGGTIFESRLDDTAPRISIL